MGKRANAKATKAVEQAQRRAKVSRLYVRGVSQTTIAKNLKVSTATVQSDLKALLQYWKEQAIADLEERKAEELAKLNHLEEIAWQAWDMSCKPHKTKRKRVEEIPEYESTETEDLNEGTVGHTDSGEDDSETPERLPDLKSIIGGTKGIKQQQNQKTIVSKLIKEETEEGRVGDPRFLDRVAWCIETRMKTLGMFALDKNQNTSGTHITINWDQMTVRGGEQRQQLIDSNPIEQSIKNLTAQRVQVVESSPTTSNDSLEESK